MYDSLTSLEISITQHTFAFFYLSAVHHGLSSSMSSYNVNERPYQTSPDRKINKMMNDENENDEMEVISSDDSPSKN